ncbi:MAG: DUF3300 domain-containing protein [Burkholderiales bacterium]
MSNPLVRVVVAVVGLVVGLAGPAGAQPGAPSPAGASGPTQAAMAQEQLDALLAPIALHPDQLLTQILMASTYPLDVVEAARFVQANPDLKGEALDDAVTQKSWDPSVQSLTAFPQVLEMMNEKLDWTQQLGDAFLADEARVLATVQRLREKATAAGNLKSTDEQKVVVEERTIIIEPARPDWVYVPVYNPLFVYGPWWSPVWRPWFWAPPPRWYPGAAIVGGAIGFGIGWAIATHHWNHWHWCHPNWRAGRVNVSIERNVFVQRNVEFRNKVQAGVWEHNPAQRRGVAYANATSREKFQKVDRNAVSARREYRGHEPANKVGGDNRRGGLSGGPVARSAPGAGAAGTGDRGGISPGGVDKSQAKTYANRGAASRGAGVGAGGGPRAGAARGGGGGMGGGGGGPGGGHGGAHGGGRHR